MRLRRIDHVGIVVADLDAHIAQLEALGLSLGRSSDGAESHAEYYPCGDASVELIDVRDPAARARRLPAGEQARIEHIAFEVDSPLEEIRDGLEARGVEVSWPPWPSGDARDDLDDGRDQRGRPVPVHAAPGAAVRVALIGAGAIAQRHVAVLERREGVSVAAVCDTDAARAAQLGRPDRGDRAHRLGGDARRRGAGRRVRLHAARRARDRRRSPRSQRGLAVYLEKPLARDADDGVAIVDAWRSSGAVCGVGYQWRSLDVVAELRALLAGRRPGMLVSRSFGHTESGRGDLHTESWFTDQRRSGGILYELGSHDVDLQIAIAGPVEWVQGTASTGTLALAGVDGARLDDTVSVVMRFASGGIGSLHVAWTEVQDPAVYSLDVQAPDAALLLRLDPAFHLTGRAGGREVDSTAAADPRESAVDRFLEAARAGDPSLVPCTPADALHTLRTLLACERAIETGERVAVGS